MLMMVLMVVLMVVLMFGAAVVAVFTVKCA
jgi:hypothetical protein